MLSCVSLRPSCDNDARKPLKIVEPSLDDKTSCREDAPDDTLHVVSDLEHQPAAGFERSMRLRDQPSIYRKPVAGRDKRDARFMIADLGRQRLMFSWIDVRRVAHDEIELRAEMFQRIKQISKVEIQAVFAVKQAGVQARDIERAIGDFACVDRRILPFER